MYNTNTAKVQQCMFCTCNSSTTDNGVKHKDIRENPSISATKPSQIHYSHFTWIQVTPIILCLCPSFDMMVIHGMTASVFPFYLSEPADDLTYRGCLEEQKRKMKNAVQHLVMQNSRGMQSPSGQDKSTATYQQTYEKSQIANMSH